MQHSIRHTVLLAAGPLAIAAAFALTLMQSEPVSTHFYLVAWYGLIFSLDRVIHQIEGTSLINRCGLDGFSLILFWSAAVWFFFELLNFRLQNWYYVFVTDSATIRFVGTFIAFGTVFPGIFWIGHTLSLLRLGRRIRGPGLVFSARQLVLFQVAGLLFLVLPMLQPQLFFALVWGSAILFVAPINYRHGIDGLLLQLERGEYGPTVRMLLAGMVAGLCWEFFNFWARAKWIYTVPFFDELKLFEMPLAGFIGFPPFAVECACIYRLLVWHRLAPAFGEFSQQKPSQGPNRQSLALVFGGVFSVLVFLGVESWTVASMTPRVSQVESLDVDVQRRLEDNGIVYLTQLRGPGSTQKWRTLSALLEPTQRMRLERLTNLYLHQGIGTEHGNALVRAGVASMEDLARYSTAELSERLSATTETGRMPTMAQLRVWRRRAGARVDR